jgi:ATP-dependent DNA helicase PIF1
MLTRNLDFKRCMVNGAEVKLLGIHAFSLHVQLSSGQQVVLPRINFVISPDDSGLPFTLHRRQYPIIPSFALTVHRVQGQTLSFLGLYFSGDVFCHGMLYTALSRVRSWILVRVFRVHGSEGVACVLRNMVRSHIVRHLRRA